MREDNVEFVRAEIIKFEKPGIPVDKKRHQNKK